MDFQTEKIITWDYVHVKLGEIFSGTLMDISYWTSK